MDEATGTIYCMGKKQMYQEGISRGMGELSRGTGSGIMLTEVLVMKLADMDLDVY